MKVQNLSTFEYSFAIYHPRSVERCRKSNERAAAL